MQTPVKFKRHVWRDVAKCKWLYVMLLIPLAFCLLFKYWPMTGLVMAFKNFKMMRGIWGSAWNGLDAACSTACPT